jgi:hypothetical protein
MWDEMAPPVPIAECKMDRAPGGCFLKHGHWINMSSTDYGAVSCGFHDMGNNTFWMNQDFVPIRR